MDSIEFVRNNTYDLDLILVDGSSNSGKQVVIRALEAYDNVEKFKEDEYLQYISILWEFKKIDTNTAQTLLKLFRDRTLYNQMIGREINLKLSDSSSIFNTPNPMKYLKRIYNDKDIDIMKEKPIYQSGIHHGMRNVNLLFDTFSDKFKLIYVNRHPAGIIYRIYLREYHDMIGRDPKDLEFTFSWRNKIIPLYAIGWEDEYLSMNNLERLIKMQYIYTVEDRKSYNSLESDRKKNIMIIKFEDFVTKTNSYYDKLSEFIGRPYLDNIVSYMKEQNCPREKFNYMMEEQWIQSNCEEEVLEYYYKCLEEYKRFK